MAGERVTWDDATQGSTISGLEQQILEMKSAKNKIIPEIDVLRPNWDTERSKKMIDALEMFLNSDFEEFIKLFDESVSRLDEVRTYSQGMDNV